MHWQDAVRLSEEGLATRIKTSRLPCEDTCTYVRGSSGGTVAIQPGRLPREARPEEVEGFLDWLPV